MNNKFLLPKCDLQETLQRFYSAVISGHQQAEQKIQVLELFLTKINEYEIKRRIKQQKEPWNIETQASLQDAQEQSLNEETSHRMIPNMLYTFLFLQNQKRGLVESNHFTKIKAKVQFQRKSLKRVLLFALLIYCLRCTKSNLPFTLLQQDSKHLLRTIKKAQVKSAYRLRQSFDRKIYAKTRFLCEKLHANMLNADSSTDQIIKIIVEEFHPIFIDQIFAQLSDQRYSQSCLRSLNSINSILQFSPLNMETKNESNYNNDEQLRACLENLNIILTVSNEYGTVEIGKRSKINVIVEQNTMGGYCLTEIALFREWKEISSMLE